MADEVKNITIKLNGDAKSAVNSINRVKGALVLVGKSISTITSSLGKLNWAIAAIQTIYGWVVKLHKKLDEIQYAVARARWKAEMEMAADATGRLVGKHERLLRLMEKENDELSKQKELRDLDQSIADDEEDGRRAADRARQIYEASTPEEEQALRDRFAAEDEQIAAARKNRGTKNLIRDTEREDNIIRSNIGLYRTNNEDISKQIAELLFNLRRATKDEDRAAINKQITELYKRKDANEEEIDRLENESRHRRALIDALEKSLKPGGGATAGEWERKAEAKRRDEAAFEEEKRRARESDDAAREFAESARQEMEADAESKLAGVRASYESALGAGQVSQNRLTALGLGSGVRGSDVVATDMRKIIDILEQQLTATRENKPAGPGQATFTE